MRVSLIAALADNGVIGVGNRLPWHLPADLKLFKRLTMGHHLILGRRTFDSIGRPLPGRRMVVLTRRPGGLPDGVQPVASWSEALELAAAGDDDEAFVAGGAEIYRLALPDADRLYLTRVRGEPPGDVFFPEVDWSNWRHRESEHHPADERHEWPLTFEIWDRRRPS